VIEKFDHDRQRETLNPQNRKKPAKEMHPIYEEPVPDTNQRAFNSLSFRGKRGYSQNILHTKRNRPNSVGGIISYKAKTTPINQVKYALVQGRYTQKWSFPKGHPLPSEISIECAKREITEETGITELPDPITFLEIGFGHYYVFHLESECPLEPKDTKEIIDTKWTTIEEMKEMKVNADVAQFLQSRCPFPQRT